MEVVIAHLCASLRFGFDMIILHPLQPEVDYLSSELQGLRFGQSFFVGSHVPLRETMERKRTLLENLAGSRSAEPDANDTGVSTDVSDSAESQSFHTTMSLEDAQELVDDWAATTRTAETISHNFFRYLSAPAEDEHFRRSSRNCICHWLR